MSVTDSEQRKNRILEMIIEAYVATTNPVGSELIAKRLRCSLSPATIRNIMGELEEEGFLRQPHTSAGRVPTDRGYRFYVESVMGIRHLSSEEVQQLEGLIQPEELEAEELFDRVCMALAEWTHQAAFVVAPTVKQSKVRQIELVPVGVHKLLCVLVANDEMIASHLVEIQEPMTREEAMALGRFINTELVGLPFSELVSCLERRLLAETDSFYYLVKRSLTILQNALSTEPQERLFLEGLSYLVSQPEFSQKPQKVHEMFKCFEDQQDELLRCLHHTSDHKGLQVQIGNDRALPSLSECSYLHAPFFIAGELAGCVGILGPKRMDYARLCAMVDGMARCVTDVLNQWEHS